MSAGDAPTTKTPDQVGADRDDRYRLIEEIGRGGMASVWRAVDEVAQMEVALKILHAHLADDEGVVEAFEREAALMQSLDHPNVVRVFSLTEVDGRPAIVMELCGEELPDRLAVRERFSEEEAVAIMAPVLEALASVHDRGIVHRDVKPQNVVFADDDVPKLIDFGIGQAEELMAADEDGQIGTVEYMAPERLDELAIDARSDVYSAGVMFFELLTGHLPYRAESAAAIMRMHREAEVPDPAVFAPEISPATCRIVMRAMAKHPEGRFDGAAQMLDALRGDRTRGEPIGAHPSWRALLARFGEDDEMVAPIDEEACEWVVFVPKTLRRLAEEEGVDCDEQVEELLEEYRDRAAFLYTGESSLAKLVRYIIHNSRGSTVQGNGSRLDSFGVARGLSRKGADELIERLKERGVYARHQRRPRERRREPRWKPFVTRTDMLRELVMVGALILFCAIPLVMTLATMEGAQMVALALFGFLSAVGGALLAGLLVSEDVLEWWTGRVSCAYLADFAARPESLDVDEALDERHVELFERLDSKRLAASYERAINAALHARDALQEAGFDDESRAEQLIDDLADLAERIAASEAEVAAVRPGELAAQIRRLDRQLAAEDDVEKAASLVDKKETLRLRLVDRDAAQQRLQGLAQRLHELSSRLERLVRRHRATDEEEAPVALDFAELDIGLEFGESTPTRVIEERAPATAAVEDRN